MAVEEGVDDGDEIQYCRNHPYKNKMNPGGICAFCLQDKLGKLVSSSFPIAVFPSDDDPIPIPVPVLTITATTHNNNHDYSSSNSSSSSSFRHGHPSRIPFPITQQQQQHQRNKNKHPNNNNNSSVSAGFDFNRSKSVNYDADTETRKGFWSFLYHSTSTSNSNHTKYHYKTKHHNINKPCYQNDTPLPLHHGSTSFDRKVSRSRSVGCGSRSFSGDFFERISTGFGDCTLRRIESQREGKPKSGIGHDCIKERVKCGGLFSGFLMASSSNEEVDFNEKIPANVVGNLANGKNRSWGWTLASPIAYLSSSSSSTKRGQSNKINLNATTPSLMAK